MDTIKSENTEKDWFYEKAGSRQGPVSKQNLLDLITIRQVTYGDMVWNHTFDNWKKIEDTEFAEHLKSIAPPPLTGDKVPNTFAWLTAFAPIIGTMLEVFIAMLIWGENRGFAKAMNGDLWFVTLLLNIAFGYADEKKLRQCGVDTQKFRSFTWLVPVYLYQRAEILHQSKACFVVWIICFLLLFI